MGPWFITKDWTSWMNCRAAVRCSWSFWRATRQNGHRKTSSHHSPKPINREALPQKQLPMRKTRWASIQTLCSSEAWWGGNQFDPGPGSTTKTYQRVLYVDHFFKTMFPRIEVGENPRICLYRSITSMTSSICERCWKHDICYRIPKCWPWEDACAASCRSTGECPRCKSWRAFKTVRDRRKIKRWEIWTIYNMIYCQKFLSN